MYVLMGSNGNITSQAIRLLLQRGHRIRVIGRSANYLATLQQFGAEVAVGDAREEDFLSRAFEGASAVYTMTPTDIGAPDLRGSQAQFGIAMETAIRRSGVRRVVNLSSIGAELSSGTGPIVGLYEQEQRLNALPGLDLLHLRPVYFMENHLSAVDTIATLGVYGSLEAPDASVPMVATTDVGMVVARELAKPAARGILHLHAPRHYTFVQTAAILGRAIGKPRLQYVRTEPDGWVTAMRNAGFSQDAAEQMVEMAQWLSAGTHAVLPGPVERQKTTLEQFAHRFGEAYAATSPAV